MSEETPGPEPDQPWVQLLDRTIRPHILAYSVVVACVMALSYFAPADRGLFIPIMLWGVLVLAHYLTVRAIHTDPEWVEERSETITMNASDLSHIEDIRERMEEGKSESGRLIKKPQDKGTD
ncbi:MAG: hypothetical protein AAGF86_15920 [Pseudomonadota bacterium]